MKIKRLYTSTNEPAYAKEFDGWMALPNTTIPIEGDCLVNEDLPQRSNPDMGDFVSANAARECNSSIKDRYGQGNQEASPWVLYRPRKNCWGLVEGKETKLKAGDVVIYDNVSRPDDIYEGNSTAGYVVGGYAGRTLSWLGTNNPGCSVWRLITNGDAPAKPSAFRLPGNRIFSQPIPLP